MSADLSPLWAGEETLVPAALRGYRSWRVQDARLRSTGVSHVWNTPEVAAQCLAPAVGGGSDPDCPCDLCLRNTHASPHRGCTCGIYGWYNPADQRLVAGDVFGAVEATGRVVLASHGFRAERVRMLALAIEPISYLRSMTLSFSLYTPPSGEDLHTIARWAKEHGVPVFPSKIEMLAEFPPEDVSSLVQHDCTETCTAHPQHDDRYRYSTFGSTTFATGSGTLTVSAIRALPSLEETPRKSRLVPIVLLLWAVVGLLLSLYSLITGGPSILGITGLALNAGLAGFWGRHLIRRHRTHSEPSVDDTAEDEESDR